MLTEKQKQILEAMETRMNSAYAFFKSAVLPELIQKNIQSLELEHMIDFYSFIDEPYMKVHVDTLIYDASTGELYVKNSQRKSRYQLIEGLIDYVTLYRIVSQTLNNYGKK